MQKYISKHSGVLKVPCILTVYGNYSRCTFKASNFVSLILLSKKKKNHTIFKTSLDCTASLSEVSLRLQNKILPFKKKAWYLENWGWGVHTGEIRAQFPAHTLVGSQPPRAPAPWIQCPLLDSMSTHLYMLTEIYTR